MFEEFYTTKMSPEKKRIENRLSEISGKGKKLSKIAIIATTVILVIGAVSVSVALAAFDGGDAEKTNEPSDDVGGYDVEYNTVVAEDDGSTRHEAIVTDFPDGEDLVEGIYTEDTSERIDDENSVLVFAGPIEGDIKITAPFGERKNPITGDVSYHNGVDIEVNEGDVVFSAIDGMVEKAEFDSALGNYVLVANDEYSILSAHLSSIDVAQGDEVFAGQQIGKAGKTGMTTGPNLHVELKVGESFVDPETILVKLVETTEAPSPEQVLTAYFAHFAEADHNGMKHFCTDNFIEKRFRDNTVGGQLRAELVSMTPIKQEDSRGVHFVVSSKNLTEGKTYGVVSDDIYYTLLNVDGQWKIDSWYLKEDFEKLYK